MGQSSLNIFQESTRYKNVKTPLMLKLLAFLELGQNERQKNTYYRVKSIKLFIDQEKMDHLLPPFYFILAK